MSLNIVSKFVVEEPRIIREEPRIICLRSQGLYVRSQGLYVQTNFSVRFGPKAWTWTKLNNNLNGLGEGRGTLSPLLVPLDCLIMIIIIMLLK